MPSVTPSEQPMHWPAMLAIVLFPVLLVGLWVAILHLIATASGWRALAGAYAGDRPFQGRTYSGVNGWVGMLGYGWSLTVGGNREGFHMSVMRPFRPGQPPLFVPWDDVRFESGQALLLGPVVDLRMRRVPRVRIRLPEGVVRDLVQASERALELPGTGAGATIESHGTPEVDSSPRG